MGPEQGTPRTLGQLNEPVSATRTYVSDRCANWVVSRDCDVRKAVRTVHGRVDGPGHGCGRGGRMRTNADGRGLWLEDFTKSEITPMKPSLKPLPVATATSANRLPEGDGRAWSQRR
eukprot:5668423-Prymnesium_polylepis.1